MTTEIEAAIKFGCVGLGVPEQYEEGEEWRRLARRGQGLLDAKAYSAEHQKGVEDDK